MVLSECQNNIGFYEVTLTFILLYRAPDRTYLSLSINHSRFAMHVLFKLRAPLAAELHDLACMRVLFVLRRLSVRIPLDNALSRASRLLARCFERAVGARRARQRTLAQDN